MLPNFPKFRSLSLDEKKDYDKLVAGYPPVSDISFATLHIWWNLQDQLSIAALNNNLIINYHLPFDEQNSGLSLIGTDHVDESILALFRYMHSEGKQRKLVHVPEFVIKSIARPEQLTITEEHDYNEYLLDAGVFSRLEGSIHRNTRRDINRFLRDISGRKLELKPLDLSSTASIDSILATLSKWQSYRPAKNDPSDTEHDAIVKALSHARQLEMRHVGLYIDDALHGFAIYHQPVSKDYFIVNHLRVNYELPYLYDFLTHHIASQATKENVPYLNFEMDLGIENLRKHKMHLRPIDFFRKYTITPANIPQA